MISEIGTYDSRQGAFLKRLQSHCIHCVFSLSYVSITKTFLLYDPTFRFGSNMYESPAVSEIRAFAAPARHTLFGQLDISHFSTRSQVAFLTSGIFFFYVLQGYVQEYLFFQLPGYHFALFTAMMQYIVYALFSSWELSRSRPLLDTIVSDLSAFRSISAPSPVPYLIALALCSAMGISLSNASLSYINFPTKVLFKSCKLLAVMGAGVVLFRKSYSMLDYLAASLLSLGLMYLSMGSSDASSSSVFGIVLIAASLAFDAASGNLQDRLLRDFGLAPSTCVVAQSAIGASLLCIFSMFSGELFEALEYVVAAPRVLLLLILYGLVGFGGVQFYLSTVKLFGIVTAQSIATARKMTTVLLSFLLFPKPFEQQYLVSMLLVASGLVLHAKAKERRRPSVASTSSMDLSVPLV